MRRFIRALPAILFAASTISSAFAQTLTGSISGRVTDEYGAPLGGASVRLRGATAAPTLSDARGTFVFSDLPPGAYAISVTKGGYEPAGVDDVRVKAGVTARIAIAMQQATLSSVRQIAHVVANAHGTFNTSEAAQLFVPAAQLEAVGPSQVNHALDEIPGVVSARSGSMNAAVPGALTSPNMRGALDYEKATLVDGHSMINGTHGDYPIMFVNGFLLDGIEVQKGPSANAPEINYAIGGTLNFRTAEPTATPVEAAVLGFDGWGGAYSNLRYSGTAANGRLGFIFDYATYGTRGPLNDYASKIALPSGSTIAGYGTVGATTSGTPVNGASGQYPVAGTVGNPNNAYVTLVACCQRVNSNFLQRGELAKLRYAFSSSTSAMLSFYGLQSQYDNTASAFTQMFSTFAPGAGYAASGSSPAFGQQILLNSTTQIPNRTLTDSEPMIEGELRTAYHNDSILARFYGAALDRFTSAPVANALASYATGALQLYGTAPVNGVNTVFTGQNAAVTIPNAYFQQAETDQLRGESLEWVHPIASNVLSLSYERTTYLTNAYTITGNGKNAAGNVSVPVPAGTRQDFSTYLARGFWQLGTRTEVTLSNYFNIYKSLFTPARNSDGSYIFKSATSTHDDPRLGVAYHASPDLSLRFESGSAVAPPFSALLDTLSQTPAQVYTPGATSVTIAQNSGALLPETSFGYNLGADLRLPGGAILSTDAYLTNIRNQFVTAIAPGGTFTTPGGGTVPVYVSTNANLGKGRFEGIDATLVSDPPIGLGYQISAALQRAYPYDVPASFYANAAGSYATNLAVIPGLNYAGCNAPCNGISNKSEAYAQGYAQVHIRGRAGQYFSLADTLYGANNTYNVPAFAVLSALYRFNAARDLSVQIYADNVLGSYDATYITQNGGTGVPLINGQQGLRNAIPYGPANVHVQIEERLGR